MLTPSYKNSCPLSFSQALALDLNVSTIAATKTMLRFLIEQIKFDWNTKKKFNNVGDMFMITNY